MKAIGKLLGGLFGIGGSSAPAPVVYEPPSFEESEADLARAEAAAEAERQRTKKGRASNQLTSPASLGTATTTSSQTLLG